MRETRPLVNSTSAVIRLEVGIGAGLDLERLSRDAIAPHPARVALPVAAALEVFDQLGLGCRLAPLYHQRRRIDERPYLRIPGGELPGDPDGVVDVGGEQADKQEQAHDTGRAQGQLAAVQGPKPVQREPRYAGLRIEPGPQSSCGSFINTGSPSSDASPMAIVSELRPNRLLPQALRPGMPPRDAADLTALTIDSATTSAAASPRELISAGSVAGGQCEHDISIKSRVYRSDGAYHSLLRQLRDFGRLYLCQPRICSDDDKGCIRREPSAETAQHRIRGVQKFSRLGRPPRRRPESCEWMGRPRRRTR